MYLYYYSKARVTENLDWRWEHREKLIRTVSRCLIRDFLLSTLLAKSSVLKKNNGSKSFTRWRTGVWEHKGMRVKFYYPNASECIQFKQIWFLQQSFKCPHHLFVY